MNKKNKPRKKSNKQLLKEAKKRARLQNYKRRNLLDFDYFKELNYNESIPYYNLILQKIVLGCNYHFKGQSNSRMRFVLTEVKGERARLQTRTTNSDFWVDLDDLLFINSEHNMRKALKLRKHRAVSKEEIQRNIDAFGEVTYPKH